MYNQFAVIHNTLCQAFASTSHGKMKSTIPTRQEFNAALVANHKRDLLVDELLATLNNLWLAVESRCELQDSGLQKECLEARAILRKTEGK